MRAYLTAALFTAALLTPGMAAAQTAAGDWLVRVRGGGWPPRSRIS